MNTIYVKYYREINFGTATTGQEAFQNNSQSILSMLKNVTSPEFVNLLYVSPIKGQEYEISFSRASDATLENERVLEKAIKQLATPIQTKESRSAYLEKIGTPSILDISPPATLPPSTQIPINGEGGTRASTVSQEFKPGKDLKIELSPDELLYLKKEAGSQIPLTEYFIGELFNEIHDTYVRFLSSLKKSSSSTDIMQAGTFMHPLHNIMKGDLASLENQLKSMAQNTYVAGPGIFIIPAASVQENLPLIDLSNINKLRFSFVEPGFGLAQPSTNNLNSDFTIATDTTKSNEQLPNTESKDKHSPLKTLGILAAVAGVSFIVIHTLRKK